jgi:hypothetical protein
MGVGMRPSDHTPIATSIPLPDRLSSSSAIVRIRVSRFANDVLDAAEADDITRPQIRTQLLTTVDQQPIRTPQIVNGEQPIEFRGHTRVQARQTGIVDRDVRLSTPPEGPGLTGWHLNHWQV